MAFANTRRVLSAALALLLGAVPLARAEPETVKVGIIQAASDAALYIADKKGYFEQEGIKVQFVVLRNMIPSLTTGQIDVAGISTSASLYNAAARGMDVKIVADKGSTPPGFGFQPILVRKDLVTSGKVKSFADFKGLKVAGFNNGSASMSTLSDALAKGGLKLSDVNVVFMAFAQHVLALSNGAVDASITTEPSASAAIKRGVAVRFASDDSIYPNHQLAVLLYSGEFVKNRADVGRRFMHAYVRAAREYNDALKDDKLAGANAAEVIAILTEYTAIKDPQVFKDITPAGIDPNGGVYVASLKKDLEFFRAQGLISGKVTVEQVLDTSFAEAAVKEMGPYVRHAE